MASVRSHAEDMSMSVDETVETLPQHCDPCAEDHDDMERESLSQLSANFLADMISSEESSQAPTSSVQVASSQQPSPELLMSLGVKVRDFAYENTLPAIVPVPRVPRQVQPAPRAPKRAQRDWDHKEGHFSPGQLLPGKAGPKKLRSLEREPTEPLQEPVVQHTRALERVMVKRLCSIIAPPPRALSTPPRVRLSASPSTSPLTPPLSHLASQESELVQTPSAFPFVVHVDDPSMIPASQLDSASQPPTFHPVLYTRFTMDSRSSPGCSPAPSPLQNASPTPSISPFLELPSPIKESGADLRVRKGHGRGNVATTPPPNRYQLRQRPTPSSRASSLSRCSHQASSTSKSHPRRTRRVR